MNKTNFQNPFTENSVLAKEPALLALWNKIASFEFDDRTVLMPFSKCLARDASWTSEFTELAILEYREFMFRQTRKNASYAQESDMAVTESA